MSDFLTELDFFRREALTAQQQFFTYLALHRVPFEQETVLRAMNREPLMWLTMRETALQGAITSLGRIFDTNSKHNVGALLTATGKSIGDFTRANLGARKVANGLSSSAAHAYANDRHELDSRDLRQLKKEVTALRMLWDRCYRHIRHKVYAHSELIDSAQLFAKTNIDELVHMLDRLEYLYDTLWDAFHNGREPGSLKRIPLQFPVPAHSYARRAGEEVYRQTDDMLRRLAASDH